MRLIHDPLRGAAVAVLGLATIALTGALSAAPATASPGPHFTAIRNSMPATTDKRLGPYSSPRMSVEVALAPRDEATLNGQLRAMYTAGGSEYHRWLAKGQFDASYAPASTERAAVASYLRGTGLSVGQSSSPFLIRATGSSRQIESAFRTTLGSYVDPRGVRYFSNSSAVQLPSSLIGGVLGVIGLSNTVREHSMIAHVDSISHPAAKPAGSSPSCETPYFTKAQLFKAINHGVGFPYGYGGGPGCNGLTPSQTNSLYSAPSAGPRGKGAGVNAAVFELSAYQRSDIDTWAHTFYGPSYSPRLSDINVDGGPLHRVCPAGDTCPAKYNYYAGDVEVDADIEMELAIAPDASHLLVYNAPNDYTGQTELDEYTAIARQDIAATVSSSWAVCENDVSAGYVRAENVVFEQMAMQGQSVFSSAGDTGAFSCIRSDGTTIANVLDPTSQPWVTSVGGTSLESDNPRTSPHPAYPRGVETVWNTLNLCGSQGPSASNDGKGGFFWCAETGSGGGGSSQWWGRPFYQHGAGVTNPYTTYGNGSTHCALATAGTPCREEPDISADADPNTGYAEYCTDNARTRYGICSEYSSADSPGWFLIGGTSLSSPLWGALLADRDSYNGCRTGNANPLLYQLYNADPGRYFHDIGRFGNGPLTPGTNGLFPTTPGFDLATGIGTPNMAAIITGR
jgi:kumamolisin